MASPSSSATSSRGPTRGTGSSTSSPALPVFSSASPRSSRTTTPAPAATTGPSVSVSWGRRTPGTCDSARSSPSPYLPTRPCSCFFSSLGIAFRFAEIEYVAKVNDLIGESKEYATLNDILDKDDENDSIKKQGCRSRNLRRVRLGLGLIKALFEQFLATDYVPFQGCSLYDAATIAYGQACASFHSWAIRKAVGAGMYTLPSREQLILRLNETDYLCRRR